MVLCNNYYGLIVAFILSAVTLSHQVDEPTNLVGSSDDDFFFNLKGGEPNELYEIRTTLSALKNYTIHVSNIPPNFGFIIVQAHGYIHEIALTFPLNLDHNNFVIKGTNVGLKESRPSTATAFFGLSNPNPLNVSVMINVVGYSQTTPIPGGCNMVFNVEVAPYLELTYNDSLIEVTSQPGMSATNNNCNRNSLTYEIYHLYQLERDFSMESYFKYLKMMMTVDSIRAHGRKVPAPLIGTNQKKRYSAYPGTGSVYAVIVSETQMGVTKSAAYVPIHTYACSTIHLSGSCNVLNTTLTKTVAATIFCVGMFLCTHGHVSPNIEMYIVSSLLSGIFVAYHSHNAVNVIRPLVSGLGFGLVWLLIWSCCCSSYISRISTYAASGIVLTSFAFYGGLGDVQVLENDTNFWLLFGSLTLLSVVIFHIGHHRTCILGCSIVGAYLTIIPIDHYIGSNLKYAFINIIRRSVVENFNLATIDPPFQFRDMILVVLLFLLVIIGFSYQHHKFKKRPEYALDSPPHNFQYFEPSSMNEHTPVIGHEESGSSPYPWWFDATSPGSDSVFSSPHPQTLGHIATFGYPQGSQAIFSDAALRFIPAPLRCNPILRQQPLRKPSMHPTTPERTAAEAHAFLANAAINPSTSESQRPGWQSQGQPQGQSRNPGPSQGQEAEGAKYPRVPKDDSDSDNEAPPPPYDSLHH